MTVAPTPLLAFESVHATYGASDVLQDIHLALYPGEIVTLIGANGAGKSTLLMSIFGQPLPHKGSIYYQNTPLAQYPTHHISRLGIALCPEGRRLFSQMTVLENIMMGALYQPRKAILEQLEFVYYLFPILKERHTQKAGTLSGGEQQMVAIGRSLMAQPTLLLLDEPSLGLAPRIVQVIFSVLRIISERGTTLFLVEQNASEALKIADRGYVLSNGKIVLADTSDNLLSNPSVKHAYLGDLSCKDCNL